MKLSYVQETLNSYLSQNPVFVILMNFSKVIILLSPCIALVGLIPGINILLTVIGYIGSILYIAYILGIIICFAKDEMLCIAIAFAVRALYYLLSCFVYSFSFNSIVYMLFYLFVAYLAMKNSKVIN